jgi:hypothetical protein
VEPENYDCVTVFFSDIVGYTDISKKYDVSAVYRIWVPFADSKRISQTRPELLFSQFSRVVLGFAIDTTNAALCGVVTFA